MSQDDSVPFVDLDAQNAPLLDEILAAIERVARSGRFILGDEVTAFEREVAAVVGTKHAIGVSNGSDALVIALMALGIGPGDEVITTPFSFFATAGSIARVGARPVFADVDPRTLHLDTTAAERAIGSRTRAILPVHLYGQCIDPAFRPMCKKHDVALVEDAAQALGAGPSEARAGTQGAFGSFSFFPTKNLGAFGDAGLLTTQKDALAEKARMLRAHGSPRKYHHEMLGGNFRLDALQAAVLRVKLPHLDAWNRARVANADRYDTWFAEAGLPPQRLTTPKAVIPGHIYHQYVIRTDRRDTLRAHLESHGIGCEIHYPTPLHLQPALADLGYASGDFPEAERAAREVLALPSFPELGESRQRRVVDEVVSFLKR